MDEPTASLPQQKPRGRPFRKGEAANPKGRPRGSRDRATMLAEALMRNDLPAVVQSVIAAALSGDMVAAKLVMERLAPIRRGRPIQIDLPAIKSARDVVVAAGTVVTAVASGSLTPEEAAGVAAIIDFSRRAIETEDFECRLAALEAKG